jgi:phenylalanyl-tRNA synthetase beta chain
MKISLQWLRDYIPSLNISPTEVAQHLTSVGLEVEHVETVAPLSGKVVVGQILTAEKHPQADSLQLCSVDIGAGEPLSIICGAKNARKGLKVVVATVGSTLPKDFKIKEAKIRGVASFGMLCSEEELGLAESRIQ